MGRSYFWRKGEGEGEGDERILSWRQCVQQNPARCQILELHPGAAQVQQCHKLLLVVEWKHPPRLLPPMQHQQPATSNHLWKLIIEKVWRYGVHVVEASGMPRGGVQRLSASVHDALIQTTLNIATLLLCEPASWRISETGTPQSLSKSLSLWFWINTTTTAVYSVWGIPRFHYVLVCTLCPLSWLMLQDNSCLWHRDAT